VASSGFGIYAGGPMTGAYHPDNGTLAQTQ
jgi:hypothetical protein